MKKSRIFCLLAMSLLAAAAVSCDKMETATDTDKVTVLFTNPVSGITAGDNLITSVSTVSDGSTTAVPFTWEGIPSLEGLATVRIGQDGKRFSLGHDGMTEITAGTEPKGIYIESSYKGNEAYSLTFSVLDKKFSVAFQAGPAVEDTTVEFLYEYPDPCPEVTEGDNKVNEVTVFGMAGEEYTTDWTVPMKWKGNAALAGKATVRIGTDGKKYDLGADGSIDIQAMRPEENVPVYIESSYSSLESTGITFTVLYKSFNAVFKAREPQTFTRTIDVVCKMPLPFWYSNKSSITFDLNGQTVKRDFGGMPTNFWNGERWTGRFTDYGIDDYCLYTMKSVEYTWTEGQDNGIAFTVDINGGGQWWDELVIPNGETLWFMADPWTGAYGSEGRYYRFGRDSRNAGLELRLPDVKITSATSTNMTLVFTDKASDLPDHVVYGICIYPATKTEVLNSVE